ncbi:MAG: recombinase family protein [Alphaproteobacteria bacterium]|nr:recombinase family protein [Alphaproteobacteria bacterium]
MNMQLNLESQVTTAHRAKLAYIYVRQSTAGQVRHHQESTELQYRLVDRAALFGWPKERIEVIDDDMGKSGTSSDGRGGFQRLIAEIGLGKAGLVLSLDASRLARNNHDWHQLLELCSLFGVLIADGERIYDPCTYHDRLLLGLSGIMSEAELHQIKLRLHQGERQKAARGELKVPLPAGLVYGRDDRICFNPDEEVHGRLLHLFAKFRELGSAKAVMRHFQKANFLVPVRPLVGPSPHDVVWRPACNSRILQVLKNPAYAGAYVYGRRRRTPIGRRSGSQQCATEAVAIQDWPVCLKDAFPGYIDWEEFMANQRRLADNLNRYDANRGAPRKGTALLQGIAICGRCGRRMTLHYSGTKGNYPVYICRADLQEHGGPRCQEVRALGVDAEVERLTLEALTPDRLALAIAALGELENEARVLERQWSLKRERARYEAERARRQYDAVEPENRLVARSLERVWEDKLRQAEQTDSEYESWRREQPVSLAAADRAQIISLGEDLPRLWNLATVVERKQILRLIVKEVILDRRHESGQVLLRIVWQTGAVSEHKIRRNVSSYNNYADVAKLELQVRDLAASRKMDREIAIALNAQGLLSAHGRPFSGGEVHLLRKRWNIPTVKINGKGNNPRQWPDGTYSIQGAAQVLSISEPTVFKWLRKGRLSGHQIAKGMPWQINLSNTQIVELSAQVRRTNSSRRRAS